MTKEIIKNISYENINYSYGKELILEDVSFNVYAGQCCALIGHNGAGKTTLLKLLLGLITPNSGQVELCGGNPTGKKQKQIKAQIGFVPEMINFNSNYTGLELMKYMAKLKSVDLGDIRKKMELTKIDFARHKKISDYSKGMKQRLGLSQALLGNPKVLILDEPASGLDPDSRLILYRTLKKHAENGNSVIFSSHALNDIEPYIDKIVLLNEGKVLLDSSISEYKQSLKMPVTMEVEVLSIKETFINDLRLYGAVEINDNIINITVEYSKKLKALSVIAAEESVLDIHMLDASLESIYYTLLQKETLKNSQSNKGAGNDNN